MHDDFTETGEIKTPKIKLDIGKNNKNNESDEKNEGLVSSLFNRIKTYCSPEKHKKKNKASEDIPDLKPNKDRVKFKKGSRLIKIINFDPNDPIIMKKKSFKRDDTEGKEDSENGSIEISNENTNVCSTCLIY